MKRKLGTRRMTLKEYMEDTDQTQAESIMELLGRGENKRRSKGKREYLEGGSGGGGYSGDRAVGFDFLQSLLDNLHQGSGSITIVNDTTSGYVAYPESTGSYDNVPTKGITYSGNTTTITTVGIKDATQGTKPADLPGGPIGASTNSVSSGNTSLTFGDMGPTMPVGGENNPVGGFPLEEITLVKDPVVSTETPAVIVGDGEFEGHMQTEEGESVLYLTDREGTVHKVVPIKGYEDDRVVYHDGVLYVPKERPGQALIWTPYTYQEIPPVITNAVFSFDAMDVGYLIVEGKTCVREGNTNVYLVDGVRYLWDRKSGKLIPEGNEGYGSERADMLKAMLDTYGLGSEEQVQFMVKNFGEFAVAWFSLFPNIYPIPNAYYSSMIPDLKAVQWLYAVSGQEAVDALFAWKPEMKYLWGLLYPPIYGSSDVVQSLFSKFDGDKVQGNFFEEYGKMSHKEKDDFRLLFNLGWAMNDPVFMEDVMNDPELNAALDAYMKGSEYLFTHNTDENKQKFSLIALNLIQMVASAVTKQRADSPIVQALAASVNAYQEGHVTMTLVYSLARVMVYYGTGINGSGRYLMAPTMMGEMLNLTMLSLRGMQATGIATKAYELIAGTEIESLEGMISRLGAEYMFSVFTRAAPYLRIVIPYVVEAFNFIGVDIVQGFIEQNASTMGQIEFQELSAELMANPGKWLFNEGMAQIDEAVSTSIADAISQASVTGGELIVENGVLETTTETAAVGMYAIAEGSEIAFLAYAVGQVITIVGALLLVISFLMITPDIIDMVLNYEATTRAQQRFQRIFGVIDYEMAKSLNDKNPITNHEAYANHWIYYESFQ